MPTANMARLATSGSLPEVEIIIGQAQFGHYQFLLWNSSGKNPKEIGQGINTDQVLDKFTIGPSAAINNVADLIGRFMSWSINIAAFQSGPGQLYSVTIIIRQDGSNVPDGPFVEQGALDGAKVVFNSVKFVEA